MEDTSPNDLAVQLHIYIYTTVQGLCASPYVWGCLLPACLPHCCAGGSMPPVSPGDWSGQSLALVRRWSPAQISLHTARCRCTIPTPSLAASSLHFGLCRSRSGQRDYLASMPVLSGGQTLRKRGRRWRQLLWSLKREEVIIMNYADAMYCDTVKFVLWIVCMYMAQIFIFSNNLWRGWIVCTS